MYRWFLDFDGRLTFADVKKDVTLSETNIVMLLLVKQMYRW